MHEILHISDVHFGPHHLPDLSAGVLELVERRQPTLVVISGDLTQRAKPRQFRQAREFVDRIPVPTITVPGNHDVPMYRFWERALDPFGAYRKHFSPELEPVVQSEEMLVIGVNTAFNWTVKDGRIRRSTLRRIVKLLQEAPRGVVKIVVAHHQLVPPPRFDTQRVLTNAVEAVEVFAELGVDMVMSGHLHQAYVGSTEAYYPSGRRPVMLLHAGTTTSNRGRGTEKLRNTCNWVRIEDTSIEISHLGWDSETQNFLVWSRHTFPRRHSQPYGLGAL